MEYTNLGEIIIDFVRENHCLYDKCNVDFKNIRKKRDVWKNISETLKTLYTVNMSAEEVEKRWSSLRDMFSREKRRQALLPSDSGYEPVKKWELYRNMLFLTPYIAHRNYFNNFIYKTKTSFVQQNQSLSSLQTSTTNTCSPVKKSQQSFNISSSLYDHNYNELIESIEEDTPSLNIENEEIIMTTNNEILNRPASTLSSCSSTSNIQLETSTNSNSVNLKRPLTLKPFKKIVPEMDEFAKRRRSKDDKIDRELAETSREISATIKEVSFQMHYDKHLKDGYMFAVEEGLKYVSSKNKTQCLIEVLQIIKKYKERQ